MQEPSEDIFCPKCGYNLYGIPEFRCPECGFRYDYEAIRSIARANAATTIITGQVVIVRLAFAAMFIAAGLAGRFVPGILLPYLVVVVFLWIALAFRWWLYGLSFVPDCDPRFFGGFAVILSVAIAHTLILLPHCSLGIALVLVSSAWVTALCGFRRAGFAPLSIRPELRKRAARWNVSAVIVLILVSMSFGFCWL